MQWVSDKQAIFEWDPVLTTHDNPGPIHTAVSGFAPYRSDVQSLDIDASIQLTVLADFIVRSFDPGCLPIVTIHVIGHADIGMKPDRAYEQRISLERANAVQQFLRSEVEKKGWKFSIVKTPSPPAGTPTVSTIDWKTPRGVGATQPDPDNVKRRKTPANMSDADRKRNRRVEIILEPDDIAVPVPVDLHLGDKTADGPAGAKQPGTGLPPDAPTQIIIGYTLIPRGLQAVTGQPDPLNPLATQHQFSFTITKAHHPKDEGGRETSFQGSVTFDDRGNIVNIQAGGQEAIVKPLLNGWIQVSAFVQVMVAANWSKSATGEAIITPVVQPAIGVQGIVTPNFSGGPFKFLNGRVQVGIQIMGTATLPAVPPMVAPFAPGPSAGVSGAVIVNIPFDWL
jgi:outer membrane protein OmpA-like peptidoglycan-associated protein